MAILKIARIGHPILRAVSSPVEDPTAPQISLLIKDMINTLEDSGGVGLAAPQVHIPLRIMIFKVPAAETASKRYKAAGLDENTSEIPLTVLINPEIEIESDETNIAFEGCLSIPDMMGQVCRYSHIRYKGVGLNGNAVERDATGFHARVVQHENDHLDGILYPQRLSEKAIFGYNDELLKSFSSTNNVEKAED